MCLEEAVDDGSTRTWALAIRVGDLARVQCVWIQPGPALPVAAFVAVNH